MSRAAADPEEAAALAGAGRVPRRGARSSAAARLRAYVALTKPRIVELLLVTTVPTMALAAGSWPGTWLVVATLVGGSLGAGAANALNCWWDRDIDVLMARTARRPLVTAAVPARHALVEGLLLAGAAAVWLTLLVNALAALVVVAAIAHYVLVYTVWLKRRTAANVFWGGLAGAAPVLTGWAAVTGTLELPAWLLFAVVFLWQPPHTWALASKFADDYARAGVPMLPVVAPASTVVHRSLAYTAALVVVSLAVWPLSAASWVYGLVALGAGAWFSAAVLRLARDVRRGDAGARPIRLFHASTTYLTVLFAGLLLDALLPLR